VPHFAQQTRPQLPASIDVSTATPQIYFELFFYTRLCGKIAENTNAYVLHWQVQKRITTPGYQDLQCYDMNSEEIMAYLGLNILFGLNPTPFARMYWSSDPWFQNDAVCKLFTVNHYEKLAQYLHINNRQNKIAKGHLVMIHLAKSDHSSICSVGISQSTLFLQGNKQ
jgi:hypothetical protein